jgi:hypothetical protein
METLFRFVLRRPAVEPPADERPIRLRQQSPFQENLRQALAEGVRTDVVEAARVFAGTAEYATDLGDVELGAELTALSSALDDLTDRDDNDDAVDHDAVVAAITDATGAEPDTVVDSDAFGAGRRRLRDSILAVKLLPAEQTRPLHRLADGLRSLELIERVTTDETFPADRETLARFRRQPLELPDELTLESVLASPAGDKDDDGDDEGRRVAELVERFTGLTTAVEELSGIDGSMLVESESRASSKVLPQAELRPQTLFTRGIENATILAEVVTPGYTPRVMPAELARIGGTVGGTGGGRLGDGRGRRDNNESGDEVGGDLQRLVGTARTAVASANAVRKTFSGRPSFRPLEAGQVGFRLAEAGLKGLSERTQGVLDELNINPRTYTVDGLVDSLRTEMTHVTDELSTLSGQSVEYGIKRIGNTSVVVTTPIATQWGEIHLGGFGPRLPPLKPVPDARIPHTHAEVAPAGVADLIVVRQQLTGYEAVDISHVENVLQSERKAREHRRRRETEELIFRETEVTTSEERALESTDRFEMVRETSETIAEEASLSAGLSVSGKYGPTVEFSASAEGSLSRSKEQAVETASTFAREVTQRSASKLTERVLERESLRVTNEVEETTEHSFDNVDGDGHVIGIYQWLEKVYEAQLFNYGLRTMYEFTVPEPGAFLLEAFRRAHADAVELEKPLRFSLQPNQLTEHNYHFWVHRYGATDVSAPPEPYVTKSLDYSAGGGDDKVDYNHSAQVQIDEGYRAVHASVGVVMNIWEDDFSVDVVVGRRPHRFGDDGRWVWSTPLDNERGSVPFGLNTHEVSDIAAVVEVKCQRTERAFTQWRHDTHAKLTQAYRARLAEYEERLAQLEAEADLDVEGRNPAANRRLVRDELKKACISVITDQHYDLFDAIETGSNGLPQVDLFEAEGEGPYVRFFEQAFEWEHMSWVTYPYYWGRKSEWATRIGIEDTDPDFEEFLKAGYCRVSVPVREGFEGAVDHFVTMGEIWTGGPLPAISSPLFVPIAEEIAERLGRPGDEVPEGEPWEVRVPTSLVRVREGADLPTWERDAEGNWVPQ